MARIRVGYVIGSLELGGSERQLLELASRLDRTRFEPSIFCLSRDGAQAEAARRAGVPVTSFGVGPVRYLKWARWTRRLRRLCLERPLDIVHAYLFPSYGLAALAARGTPARLVAGVRAVGVAREAQWPFSLLDSAGLARARRIVVNAEAVRAALATRRPEVVDRIMVIYNGIDLQPYAADADREAARARLGLESSAFVALMVANLIDYKGHEEAIRALGLLRRRVGRAVLALAGAGPQEPRLRSLAREMGLEEAVLFLGRRDDVPALLCAADVVLLASWHEGLPNAVMEAMAAARPVVSTDVGGVGELVTHGVTGLLVPPSAPAAIEAALFEVASDPALAGRLGQSGRARVAQAFSWAAAVRAHEEMYASLCERA